MGRVFRVKGEFDSHLVAPVKIFAGGGWDIAEIDAIRRNGVTEVDAIGRNGVASGRRWNAVPQPCAGNRPLRVDPVHAVGTRGRERGPGQETQ